MTRSSRRSVLAAVGVGLTSVAGCVSAPEREPRTADESDSESTSTPVQNGEVNGTYTEVYRETIGSVALLRVLGDRPNQGSGFVYDGQYLVTNQHVVEGADSIDVQYVDNDWSTASVVGTDVHSDLAVVEVADRPEYATPLPFASDPPEIGQEVIALGNPLGFDSSVSQGIVSGVNRSLEAPTEFAIPNAVQTDAALNPGNSGGPLVNLDGEIVAVVTAGTGEGIGFGISAALCRRVVPALIDDGEFRHSYMGISLVDVTPRVAERNDLDNVDGVIVAEVLDGTPADEAGLQGASDTQIVDGITVPVGGDVIVALDEQPISISEELSTYLALETDPGDTIDVTVLRNGEQEIRPLTLDSREEWS